MKTSNATERPFIVLPSGPVSPHRISAANGQHRVNEARGRAEISIDERADARAIGDHAQHCN
jgi:hypothetical protein